MLATPTISPSAPTNLAIVTLGVNQITVDWDKVQGVSYTVSHKVFGSATYTESADLGQVDIAIITGLTVDTEYEFIVTATNSVGSATSSSV